MNILMGFGAMPRELAALLGIGDGGLRIVNTTLTVTDKHKQYVQTMNHPTLGVLENRTRTTAAPHSAKEIEIGAALQILFDLSVVYQTSVEALVHEHEMVHRIPHNTQESGGAAFSAAHEQLKAKRAEIDEMYSIFETLAAVISLMDREIVDGTVFDTAVEKYELARLLNRKIPSVIQISANS